MGSVYRPGEHPAPGEQAPAGLAIGDSWFWHPNQAPLLALANHPRCGSTDRALSGAAAASRWITGR